LDLLEEMATQVFRVNQAMMERREERAKEEKREFLVIQVSKESLVLLASKAKLDRTVLLDLEASLVFKAHLEYQGLQGIMDRKELQGAMDQKATRVEKARKVNLGKMALMVNVD